MKVLKFGGSSVANSENIKKVISIVEKASTQQKVVVVVSAMGKTTDNLLEIANLSLVDIQKATSKLKSIQNLHTETIHGLIESDFEKVKIHVDSLFYQLHSIFEGIYLLQELSDKTIAKISSYGELLSSYIIAQAFKQNNDAGYVDSRSLITANKNYLNAQVNFEVTNQKIQTFFAERNRKITVCGGFIASNKENETTTLGRGGSDYSAAIYAAALDADILEIWTDVSGMFTANPKLVKQAKPISEISYEEAMELSHFGAKVLYPPTIAPALQKLIPICIKNTFEPTHEGTLISKETTKECVVKGISHIENISLITLEGSGMIGIPGFSKRLFETLSKNLINVIFITQASSEHSICVGVYESDAVKSKQFLDEEFAIEIEKNRIKPILCENDLAIIAVVGDQMKDHQGLSGQMFSALGRNNVNVRAIAQGASERNISAVIKNNDAKKALNTLHEQFFEERVKQLNLFVTGVGNVGKKFLEQIQQQKSFLKKNLKLQVKVTGISNSKTMVFDEDGIDLSNWNEALQKGEPASINGFYEKAKELNLRNSVFVDNTANPKVAEIYEYYLKQSMAVVTCNKIASSSTIENYKKLKSLSKTYNAQFLFETNVGAGLPIIDTLKNLIVSGDKVHTIQAVLSGTLNYVFNHFDDTKTFKDVVQTAQELGYTEPDPKIDLSGIDVARKILILARESGYDLELTDIKNNSFLSKKALETTNNDDFYAVLGENEADFQKLYQEAKANNCRLKYVAEFTNGKANVGLQHIPENHPFYNLEGSDNIVLFFTNRYPQQPLQIKGAGAGADVTASGIFADIIRIANQ